MTNGSEVLLKRSLLGGFPLRGQKYSTDIISRNMEERDLVFYAVEVRGDVHPDAEVPTLVLGGDVFLE